LSFVLYIIWCIVLYLDSIKVIIIIPVFYIDSISSLAQFLTLLLSQQDHQLSATSARSLIICSRIILSWTRLILLHLVHSSFVYMRSSFRRIKRMRKCLSRIARQKTRDFHQRRDERCVNFFNDEHVRWFFCFWIFDYWMSVYFLTMKLVTYWSHWLTSKLLTIHSLMKWLRRLFVISCKSSLWLWSRWSQFENSTIIMLRNSLLMSFIQIWLFKIIWLTQLLCWSLD